MPRCLSVYPYVCVLVNMCWLVWLPFNGTYLVRDWPGMRIRLKLAFRLEFEFGSKGCRVRGRECCGRVFVSFYFILFHYPFHQMASVFVFAFVSAVVFNLRIDYGRREETAKRQRDREKLAELL